jgi:SAM-dependent methyltransferase
VPAFPSFLSRLLRAPAVQAALLQLLAFPATLLLVYAAARAGLHLSMAVVALLQGALAALLTWRRGLAKWWRLIQLLFPVSLLGAGLLDLPPALFLLVFLFLLGLYWSTFRTQVPFFPSGPSAWKAVEQLLPRGRPVRLIDIGSGLGGLVLSLAQRRPDSHFMGIELAPLPWLASRVRARITQSRASFIRGDYETLDFGQYDVVFAYLSPAAMPALWKKASREMKPGTMLISYEFNIPAKPADKTIEATPFGPALYVWCF